MPATPSIVGVYVGIYEVPEAARYISASTAGIAPLRVSSARLVRWIRAGLALPDLATVPGRELLIAFEDVISMRIIAALRAAGVSMQRIRRAEAWLRQTTGMARPFAAEQLWTERSEVFIEFRDRLLAASRRGQYALELFREYLIPVHGLSFGQDQVVISWEPVKGVLLHPQIQLGVPCVKGTRIPTKSIAAMIAAGEAAEDVARVYRIATQDVVAAVGWEHAAAA